MRQVYSYVFFIAESKSNVRLRGPAVIIREKRKKHDFVWFFGIKIIIKFYEIKL